MTRCIGIDLGTINCCMATIDDAGNPCTIANALGENTTPSVVSYQQPLESEVQPIVGSAAMQRALSHPLDTIHGIKRLMGRRYDDPEIVALASTSPYCIRSAPNGDACVEVQGVQISAPEVSASLLSTLRAIAEEQFDEDVNEAIITVPAHFDNAQRRATADAATIAGLKVRRLLNEATAAVLGYGAHRGQNQRLAVCDLGGGTFDVSIVNVEDGIVEVISSQGGIFLGGGDVDRAIIDRLLIELQREHGVDLADEPEALQRFRAQVVAAKHTLSEARSATIELSHLARLPSGSLLDYKRTIKRAELSSWIGSVINRIAAPCREAAAQCRISPTDVDGIVLVGGMTRMPSIQNQIASIFGRPPLKAVNPEEIVAVGAASQCAILDGRVSSAVVLDVTSQSLGLLSADGKYQQVIPRNATIPTREHRIVTTTEEDQNELYFEVFEGDSANPGVNRKIGRFVCRDLPKAPAGEVMVLVEFTVDINGVLRIATSELGGEGLRELRIVSTTGLTRAELRGICARSPRRL